MHGIFSFLASKGSTIGPAPSHPIPADATADRTTKSSSLDGLPHGNPVVPAGQSFQTWRLPGLRQLERKHVLEVPGHPDNLPTAAPGGLDSLFRTLGITVFAGLVVMVEEQRKSGPFAVVGVFEHGEVAVGIAEGQNGSPPDVQGDIEHLFPVDVIGIELVRLDDPLASLGFFEFIDQAAADHPLDGDPVQGPRKDADEVGAAPRNDKDPEIVGAQVVEQFHHRLIDKLGVKSLVTRMTRPPQPAVHSFLEGLDRRACETDHERLLEFSRIQVVQSDLVAIDHGFVWLLFCQFGVDFREGTDALEAESELEGDGFFKAEGAVVVEDGDSFLYRDEGRASGLGDVPDEGQDPILGFTGVPGRKRILAGHHSEERRCGKEQAGEEKSEKRQCEPTSGNPGFHRTSKSMNRDGKDRLHRIKHHPYGRFAGLKRRRPPPPKHKWEYQVNGLPGFPVPRLRIRNHGLPERFPSGWGS
ncbi:hypothetical protein TRIP_B250220 [uncultured Desulfatiglans sp.]|nr:hypothetical protein TRIP_B250220 [uncultured Desulfatiglans sp.]